MKIAIIGGGPSGTVAAALLARRGHEVVIFDEDNRPELIVGESLVPGSIPVLRRLGLEQEVAAIGTLKPGATFQITPGKQFAFSFKSLPGKYPPYAYNVPRPAFDELLRKSANASGAKSVVTRTELLADGDRLLLPPAALELADWNRQPDLLIDASGRRRLSARTLHINARLGERKDVAHFAHFTGFAPETPAGQLRINRLENGWSWRIALRGKTSFGIVLHQEAAAALGQTPEERLEAAIAKDPCLSSETANLQRLTPAQSYANYQLISERGAGANWVAVGDAFGFVDPMLSPGMMVAMEAGVLLDAALAKHPLHEALSRYAASVTHMLEAWMDLISYFYNGRIFKLHDRGIALQSQYRPLPLGFMETFMSRIISGMASGFTTGSPFSRGVLRSVDRFVLGHSTCTADYAIV